MLKIQNNTTEDLTREELLQTIWDNKQEKRDTKAGLGMYVSLDSPEKLTVKGLVGSTLSTLVRNPEYGLRWAEDFGRVIVAVHPSRAGTVDLQHINDKSSKGYVSIESATLIDPSTLLNGHEETGLNIVLFNNTPVTIEGFVVMLIHMVDEVIWTRYLEVKNETGIPELQAYKMALQEVTTEGISFVATNEDTILDMYKASNGELPVRMYGSGAIKSVPVIMGACLYDNNLPRRPVQLNTGINTYVPIPKNENQCKLEGETAFGAGITISKQLHAGHLFLLTFADMLRGSTDNKVLEVFNNDTAPRVGEMLVYLAHKSGNDMPTTAALLRQGYFTPAQIAEAYRNRKSISNPRLLDAVMQEVNQGGILNAMTGTTMEELNACGLRNITLASEAEYAHRYLDQIFALGDPSWLQLGFLPLRTGSGLKILAKRGELSPTGKVMAFFANLLEDSDSVVLVDSGRDSFDAANAARYTGADVMQVAGAGCGINGSIGSGTGGELPSINQIAEIFGADTVEIVRFFLLTRYQVSRSHPGSQTVETFYDFCSAEALFQTLGSVQQELIGFKREVSQIMADLEQAQGNTTEAPTKRQKKVINALPRTMQRILNTPTLKLIQTASKPKVLNERPMFRNMVKKTEKIMRRQSDEEILRIVLTLIQDGADTNIKLLQQLQESGVMIGGFPTKEVNIQSDFLQIALDQGYEGDAAIEKALKYLDGSLILSIRRNPYFGTLKKMMKLANTVNVWSVNDANIVIEIMRTCMSKLGFDI